MGRSLGIGTWLAEPLDFEVPSNSCIFGGLAAGQTVGTSAPVLHFCSGKPQESVRNNWQEMMVKLSTGDQRFG